MTAQVARGALDMIGGTPLVRVSCFDTAGSELWVKLESHGDLLGRICGLLSGKSAEATNQAMNHVPGGPGS